MRIVHTADWHLGHTLGGFSRDAEHARFLGWLLALFVEEQADALFVCGDVFDHGNPPAAALRLWYDFLAEAHRLAPRLQTVVIAGNHDAPVRLEAPAPILAPLGVRVIGSLPRVHDGASDAARAIVPLIGASGDIEAVVAAVPFLRPPDLVAAAAVNDERPTDAIAATTTAVLEAAARARRPGQALLALGHGHLLGGRVTPESERATFHGDTPLSASVFGAEVGYVAFGHLHLAQPVEGRREVRYAGSPVPLSFTERDYAHQVAVVELDGERLVDLRARVVPRTAALLRVPSEAAPLDEVLDRLRALDAPERPEEERPFVEVRVRLREPVMDLRAQVERALEAKAVRLVRVQAVHDGEGAALADELPAAALADVEPALVLARLYRRRYGEEVPAPLSAAFAELLESVMGGGSVDDDGGAGR